MKPDVDLSAFEAEAARKQPGQRLKATVLLETLPPEQSASLLAALRGGFSPNVIETVVNGWGHVLSEAAVRKWRDRNPL